MYMTASKGTNTARHLHTLRSERKRVQRSLRRAINTNKLASNDNVILH